MNMSHIVLEFDSEQDGATAISPLVSSVTLGKLLLFLIQFLHILKDGRKFALQGYLRMNWKGIYINN